MYSLLQTTFNFTPRNSVQVSPLVIIVKLSRRIALKKSERR